MFRMKFKLNKMLRQLRQRRRNLIKTDKITAM